MADRPNIVLVMTDQQRADSVGIDPQCPTADSHPIVDTPNIDHLARDGAAFTRAYSPAPTCVPARRCMWTGQTPVSAGATEWRSDAWDFPHTLPGELTRAGYQTHLVGKSHAHPHRNHFGFEGQQLHEGNSYWDKHDRPDDYLKWLARKTDGELDGLTHGLSRNTMRARPFPFDEALHPTVWTTSQGLRFLDRRDPTRPFFLTLSYVRPHPPLDPPRSYWEQYVDRPLPEPVVGGWVDDRYGDLRPAFLGAAADELDDTVVEPRTNERGSSSPNAWCGRLSPATVHRIRAAYYGLVTQIDHQLRRLTRHLEMVDLLDDTVIIFTSDHGSMLGDHHLWYMSYAYEGSARVPFVMKFDRSMPVPRGQRIDRPIGLEDLMPTILEIAGVPIPDTVDGRSVLRLLERPDRDDWRAHYHGEHGASYHPTEATQFLVDDQMKYIWNPVTGDELLFDLGADPAETTDLSGESTYQDRLDERRSQLVDRLDGRPERYTDGERLLPERSG